MVWLVNDNLGCYIPRGKYRIHIIQYITALAAKKMLEKNLCKYILLVVGLLKSLGTKRLHLETV